MTEQIFIENKNGLHLRAAAQLVRVANHYPCVIQVKNQGRVANAKSLLGLLALALPSGASLEVEAQGQHEMEALREIKRLIQAKFGEPE